MKKKISMPWFKLDAIRFLHSNSVCLMNMEEIGTYVMLLMHSWAQAKDCLLPADENQLCAITRAKSISPLVRKQFETVETPDGPMIRNNVLYEEWKQAKRLSNKRRDAALQKEKESKTNA